MAKKKKQKKKAVRKKKAAQKGKVRKRQVVKKKKSSVRKSKKKLAKGTSKGPKLPAEPIGHVTHYFPHVKAAAVMIERDTLKTGDTLYFKGHTTRFKQKLESLQIEHQAVPEAGPGDEVGIQVRSRTREHDLVFKL